MISSKVLSFVSLISVAGVASAGIINFETGPNCVTFHDNSVLSVNETFNVDGVLVRFGFDTNNDGTLDAPAVIEQAGNKDEKNDTGFWGIGGIKDVAAPGYEAQLGDFFLRQSRPYKPFGTFTILYDSETAVTAASGEIWDIDGNKRKTEQFLVKAFNEETLLDVIESPLGNNMALDGKPWTFGFSNLIDITKIEISFIGSKTSGIGLAFNNFSPIQNIQRVSQVSVPEPSSILILACGLIGIAARCNFAKR